MCIPCRARLILKAHNSMRHCSGWITSNPTMPCVCDPETRRIMNTLHWDYILFPTGESYEDDVIPIGLFSLATLWLKLDTHTWFGPWGNMSTTATSTCHACMHRSYVICIFRRFLMTGLPVPEYWSVACLTDWFLLTNIIQTQWFCFSWTILSTWAAMH